MKESLLQAITFQHHTQFNIRETNCYTICLTYLCVKLVIAQVQRCIDWFKGLEVYVDFLLLPIISYNSSTVNNKTIGRNWQRENITGIMAASQTH